MHQFPLRDEEEIFERINEARFDTRETIAEFVRDAIRMKLRYHEKVSKPLYQEFNSRRDQLPDPVLYFSDMD